MRFGSSVMSVKCNVEVVAFGALVIFGFGILFFGCVEEENDDVTHSVV